MHQGDSARRDKTQLLPKANMKIELKSLQPCGAVSALLGLISMAQLEVTRVAVFVCKYQDLFLIICRTVSSDGVDKV